MYIKHVQCLSVSHYAILPNIRFNLFINLFSVDYDMFCISYLNGLIVGLIDLRVYPQYWGKYCQNYPQWINILVIRLCLFSV